MTEIQEIPEFGTKIEQEESINKYIMSSISYPDMISELKVKYKGEMAKKVFSACEKVGLKVVSRYYTRRNVGTTVDVTYAFQNPITNELYINIIFSSSSKYFHSLDSVINKIINFNYLESAKILKKQDGESLFSFSAESARNPSFVLINDEKVPYKEFDRRTKNIALRKRRKENILGFMSDIMYGPGKIKSERDLYCLKSGISLYREDYGNIAFGGQLHHINVIEGSSCNKMVGGNGKNIEPSVLLTKILYSEEKLELMGCIYLDSTTHDNQHYLGGRFQGYEMYRKSELPWVLQNEENYEKIISMHSIEKSPKYADFIKSLTNDNVPVEYYKKDRLIISENLIKKTERMKENYHPNRDIPEEDIEWINKYQAGKLFGNIAGNSFKQYFYIDRYRDYLKEIRISYVGNKKMFSKEDVQQAYKSLTHDNGITSEECKG